MPQYPHIRVKSIAPLETGQSKQKSQWLWLDPTGFIGQLLVPATSTTTTTTTTITTTSSSTTHSGKDHSLPTTTTTAAPEPITPHGLTVACLGASGAVRASGAEH